MTKITNALPAIPLPETLPVDGMSRWSDLKKILPISREKWRQLEKAGKAPKIIRMGIRCSFQNNREIHRWLADPLNYQVED